MEQTELICGRGSLLAHTLLSIGIFPEPSGLLTGAERDNSCWLINGFEVDSEFFICSNVFLASGLLTGEGLPVIGKELDQLSRVINDMTPVSEMPFGARCKSRKEKNKLASRACRLKKKAQHEANKVKCDGLLEEHRDLSNALEHVKSLLLLKVDPHSSKTQTDLTAEIDRTVTSCLDINVAGNTTNFVNQMIEKNLPYV